MRKKAVLSCSVCQTRNYSTEKSTNQLAIRLEMKKYCKVCHEHTLHQETK